jgi:tripartite-type tricarboxylate transporter receptor subunit TctC
MKLTRLLSLLVAGLLPVLPLALATAATYPDRPVRLIVPSAAGGAADFFSRILMVPLGQALGQPIVIENKSGASGTIGATTVAKATPDGLTLLMAQSTSVAIAPHLYKKVGYDTLTDFAPVSLVALVPNILVVNPQVPVSSVKELIALAKSKPKTLNFASAGSGAPSHLAGEMFNGMAGVDMVHVAYKGAGPAVNALLAGEVQIMFAPIVAVLPHVKAGRLKAIALTSAKPSPSVPGVPTVAQGGLPGYEISSWFGIFAPANTPKDIVDRLQKETARIVQSPEVKERFSAEGAEAVGNSPAEFSAFVKTEYVRFEKVVKDAGVVLE